MGSITEHCAEHESAAIDEQFRRGLRIRLGKRLDSAVRGYAFFHERSIADVMRELIARGRRENTVDFFVDLRELHSDDGSPEINVPYFSLNYGESHAWVRGIVEHYSETLVITPVMREKRIAELDRQIELLMSRYSGIEYISNAEE